MFYLVDAFTDAPFKGNPAGVYLMDDYPSDQELQNIAAYYNWSEIAFLVPLGNDQFRIRWFSPLDEAPLCGHATLAASHILFSENVCTTEHVRFKYNSGEICATKTEDGITMEFPAKRVSKCKNVPFSVKEVVGINDYIEIIKDDVIYVIVLNNRYDIEKAIPDFSAIKKVDCRAIAITAKCDGEFDFSSRYFAPKVGIYEDPVCGSMHCRLACYWSPILGKNKFIAHQASMRTGKLLLQLGGNIVKITGKATTTCKLN
ncbi:MAG: PhzF family phenazine biosynthesis protein [Holosporales bacterium]|nr:PhzF family phenazine biosynthesis protein [Holosporales bacterium]